MIFQTGNLVVAISVLEPHGGRPMAWEQSQSETISMDSDSQEKLRTGYHK